jgi:hypothetical protein
LKSCTNREPLEITEGVSIEVCGPNNNNVDCVEKEGGGICQSKCSNTGHYEANLYKQCVLKKCEERTVQSGLDHVCGSEDCFEKESSGGCGDSCDNENHYEPNNKGVCVERRCEDRTVNNNVTKLCGSGECYIVNYEDENHNIIEECRETCLNNRLYILFLDYFKLF